MIPVRTASPATQLVSLALAKQHLRIDSTFEDSYITALIDAVTSYLDGYNGILGQSLINQTWQQKFLQFPLHDDIIRLSVGPIQSITSVTYYDAGNVLSTLDNSAYALFTDGKGPFVSLQSGVSWPGTYSRDDAVIITYVSGYGASPSAVPAAIRQAALLLIGHFYENREATAGAAMTGLNFELPFAVSALLAPFRRVGI